VATAARDVVGYPATTAGIGWSVPSTRRSGLASEIGAAVVIRRLRARAHSLKSWVYALNLVYQDPRVPLFARLFALGVVAYALSPIDLVPDFVPVLGYLDDLVLIPLGISLAIRMIPRPVLEECRARAEAELADGWPASRVAAVVIVAVWLLLAWLGITFLSGVLRIP
jgi:uncharacterized membrane protein YkvA (DUF1232 family)